MKYSSKLSKRDSNVRDGELSRVISHLFKYAIE